jgi:nitroimidazol reductase NimA-like FMN-containing flavoprotein (pyridoxamine 5'-phosphate oxidase superfamily)
MFTRLAENEATALLGSSRMARLGCIVNGEPYVVPINYYLENGAVYSHSLPGLKISALRQNPNACLQVDHIESDFRWRSVIAFGKYEELTDREERERVLGQLLWNFPGLTPVESVIAEDAGPPPVVVYRIRIDRLTGVAEE